MPRKPAGRSGGARASNQAVAGGNGVIARAVDRAFDNPAMSGGLLVMALTATAIVSNAMFLQTRHHPEPLFSTRPSVSAPTPRPAPVVPTPRHRAQAVSVAPTPALAPTEAGPAAEPDAVLVAKIQRELARLGLYVGSIDGIAGSRTKTAIAAYETAAGRAVTGEPTAALLEFMNSVPPPSATVSAEAPSSPAAVNADDATAERKPDAAPATELYRRVQTALNRAGYGPIAVDGYPGNETADAIRRFELDNGLPITGEIGERMVARLVAIGAMTAL